MFKKFPHYFDTFIAVFSGGLKEDVLLSLSVQLKPSKFALNIAKKMFFILSVSVLMNGHGNPTSCAHLSVESIFHMRILAKHLMAFFGPAWVWGHPIIPDLGTSAGHRCWAPLSQEMTGQMR